MRDQNERYALGVASEAMKEIGLGPTGRNVSRLVAERRKKLGLTFAGLSKRLAEIGHPIPPLGLRRIEARARNVTTDDLVALSVALDVSPPYLLFPRQDDGGDGLGTGLPGDVDLREALEFARGNLGSLEHERRLRYWRNQRNIAGSQLDRYLHMQEQIDTPDEDREWARSAAEGAQLRFDHAEERIRLLESDG